MIYSLERDDLGDYLTGQLNHFFPDKETVRVALIAEALTLALQRMEKIQSALRNRHAWIGEKPFFNHLNADHYATFLYLVSYQLGRQAQSRLATKVFLLNKALHALDLYFEVELPEIFLLAHPTGTILGRARYGNFFVVMQNCTVGNIGGKYPELGERVVLASHSSVLGASVLRDGVCVGAGSLLLNATIPAHRTVVGRGKDIVIGQKDSEKWRDYFLD